MLSEKHPRWSNKPNPSTEIINLDKFKITIQQCNLTKWFKESALNVAPNYTIRQRVLMGEQQALWAKNAQCKWLKPFAKCELHELSGWCLELRKNRITTSKAPLKRFNGHTFTVSSQNRGVRKSLKRTRRPLNWLHNETRVSLKNFQAKTFPFRARKRNIIGSRTFERADFKVSLFA